MVQQLPRPTAQPSFPETAPAANPVFFRTYSRQKEVGRESWAEVCDRTVAGIAKLGQLTSAEAALIARMQKEVKALTSGRWLWIGGTEWIEQQKNFSGGYNCTSTNVVDWKAFALMMDLAMMGCGTGAMLEPKYISQLPVIQNQISLKVQGDLGATPTLKRREETEVNITGNQVVVNVGDSRQGWVRSYEAVLEASSDPRFGGTVEILIDMSDVRPAGEILKGFGGMANPVKLPDMYSRVARILNQAVGRQLDSIECCLLIDEAAVTIVAGNIRRCLPAEALVHTEAGLVPISKVRVGDLVLTSKGFYPVTNFFDQGVQTLCRIKTENGFFECTPDHKIAVLTDIYGNYEMVKAKDLKEEDRLVSVPSALPGDLVPVRFLSIEMNTREAQTYDIEVATVHEFMCEGILVSNSAGMRQFDSNDSVATGAKENLWRQDGEGNWSIDPERDALRMANHTRVFHRKPTQEETFEAVQKQFYSGEGAIQYAPEAIARASADILTTPELKSEFLGIYNELGQEEAKNWLKQHRPEMDEAELEHRFQRYGLNPCVVAETWVHTENGPRQVQDLIGIQHGTYINGELFSTTAAGFFHSGDKPVVKLTTEEGHELRLTANHKLLKVIAQTQQTQYREWVEAGDLQPGDRISLHNHRHLSPWEGRGSEAEGWLLGSLIGEGVLSEGALLNYWGESQAEMAAQAVTLLERSQLAKGPTAIAQAPSGHLQVASLELRQLAESYGIIQPDIIQQPKAITPALEQTSYDFHQGFLRGLFDTQAAVQGQPDGIRITLAQPDLSNLQAVQRMLLRLGISSSIHPGRRAAGERLLDHKPWALQPHFTQGRHELVICHDNLQHFAAVIGFAEPIKAEHLARLLQMHQIQPQPERFTARVRAIAPDGIEPVYDCTVPGPARFDANGIVAHNCGEIIGANFHCNLSEVHLNRLDPENLEEQDDAFRAAALSVAALLNHEFLEERYRQSRELDPIVGVSFTGFFDFCVHAFGTPWLNWWEAGRPETAQGQEFKAQEAAFLNRWQKVVHQTIWDYCDRQGLRRPNRCTTVQPAGTKSLLTGASSGWHPPKAQRFIRRITFRKNDPVAMACIDYGYSVVPSQSDKDEKGNLLDDPFDPRCTEWLVEIPTEVSWANLPGADQVDISQFSALAQFDFYMQVQKHYTRHNTSATVELREGEVTGLAERIHDCIQNDEGYMSVALLARFDDLQTFPRLPFEPIDQATYGSMVAAVEKRRDTADFLTALKRYDLQPLSEAGPAGCDSDKCLMPEKKPE